MQVIYFGHQKALMADFNGKRYCFEKGKPVEITQQVYDYIILSEHVDAIDLKVVLPPEKIAPEEKQENIPEEKEEKQRGRPKRKR